MSEQQVETDIFTKTYESAIGFSDLSLEEKYQVKDVMFEVGTDISIANSIINTLRDDLINGLIEPDNRALVRTQISAISRQKMQLIGENPLSKPDGHALNPVNGELPIGGDTKFQKKLIQASAKFRIDDIEAWKEQVSKDKKMRQQQEIASHVRLGMNRDTATKLVN